MSLPSPTFAASAPAGAAASLPPTRPLPDRDLLEDHRLRRARLATALRRGLAPDRPSASRGHAITGLVLAALALGGAAVGATVQNYLPGFSGAPPSSGSTVPTPGAPAPAPAPAQQKPAPTGSATSDPAAVPYSSWAQNRSQTTR